MAEKEQSDRYIVDEWEDIIAQYLEDQGLKKVTSKLICFDVFNIMPEKMDKLIQSRISGIMQRLGWESKQVWIDGKKWRGYATK